MLDDYLIAAKILTINPADPDVAFQYQELNGFRDTDSTFHSGAGLRYQKLALFACQSFQDTQ